MPRVTFSNFPTIWGLAAAVIVLGLAAGGVSPAAMVTRTTAFQDGADAYVWGGDANANFGTSGVLTSRNTPGNPPNNYKDYLRFDLTNVIQPTITGATLTLMPLTSRSNVSYEFFGLPQGLPADAASGSGGWLEDQINFVNAPANKPGLTDLTFFTSAPGDENGNYVTSLGTISLNTVGGVPFAFSSAALDTFLQADTNARATIAFRRLDTVGIVQIASRESASLAPTLTFQAELVPEPSEVIVLITALLLGGLFLGRFLCRRGGDVSEDFEEPVARG